MQTRFTEIWKSHKCPTRQQNITTPRNRLTLRSIATYTPPHPRRPCSSPLPQATKKSHFKAKKKPFPTRPDRTRLPKDSSPATFLLRSPLKKGTGSECRTTRTREKAVRRGACPLFQQTVSIPPSPLRANWPGPRSTVASLEQISNGPQAETMDASDSSAALAPQTHSSSCSQMQRRVRRAGAQRTRLIVPRPPEIVGSPFLPIAHPDAHREKACPTGSFRRLPRGIIRSEVLLGSRADRRARLRSGAATHAAVPLAMKALTIVNRGQSPIFLTSLSPRKSLTMPRVARIVLPGLPHHGAQCSKQEDPK
jgi:hypothetical protein